VRKRAAPHGKPPSSTKPQAASRLVKETGQTRRQAEKGDQAARVGTTHSPAHQRWSMLGSHGRLRAPRTRIGRPRPEQGDAATRAWNQRAPSGRGAGVQPGWRHGPSTRATAGPGRRSNCRHSCHQPGMALHHLSPADASGPGCGVGLETTASAGGDQGLPPAHPRLQPRGGQG